MMRKLNSRAGGTKNFFVEINDDDDDDDDSSSHIVLKEIGWNEKREIDFYRDLTRATEDEDEAATASTLMKMKTSSGGTKHKYYI